MTSKPASMPARQCTTQQVNYIRKTVNLGDANLTVPVDPFAKLPIGAFIVMQAVHVETVFNAGTTNVLTFGTTIANANELAAAGDINEASATYQAITTGLGVALCLTADQPLYVKYTQTGTVATTGRCHWIVGYVPNNDF